MTESVNEIIAKLADIEDTATRIVASAEDEKKDLKDKMDIKKAEFDQKLKKKTADRIDEIQKELDKQEQKEINELKVTTERSISELQELYKNRRHEWSETIFNSIVEV